MSSYSYVRVLAGDDYARDRDDARASEPAPTTGSGDHSTIGEFLSSNLSNFRFCFIFRCSVDAFF